MAEAIAEVLFGAEQAGKPVYSLPTIEQLDAIAAACGFRGEDSQPWLVTAATRDLHGRTSDPFGACLASRSHALDTPLQLPILVVLALAADHMRETADAAAHNYYRRLFELCEVPTALQSTWQHSYRRHAESLWGGLNEWLEAWEGERGVPTAYSLGEHAYVGLALSQVLVRQADRERLPRFFVSEGLPPRYRVSPADIESMLDPWMTRNPPFFSHAIRALWGNTAGKSGIATAVALELEAWDGGGIPDDHQRAHATTLLVRLMAQVRTFPTSFISFDLQIPASPEAPATISIASPEGVVELATTPAFGGTQRLLNPQSIEPESLIASVLKISSGGDRPELERRPRRVVPLRFDDLQNAFVEVERVQLGEETLLLVIDGAVQRVDQLLAQVARPGFIRISGGESGVPEGWTAYRSVQIMARFPGTIHNDLQPLLPRSSSALTLSGGFVLPGLVRKWSSLQPPEVHIAAGEAVHLEVAIYEGSRLGRLRHQQSFESQVAVLPLSELQLPDGEYLATLTVNGAKRPAATTLIRLRSSDSPAPESLTGRSDLTHHPQSDDLWPLSAAASDDGPSIDGVQVNLKPDLVTRLMMPPAHPWAASSSDRKVAVRRHIGREIAPDSCVKTGAHRYELPPADPGRPRTASIEGQCTTCGQVKRFPTTPWGANRRRNREAPKSPALRLAEIPMMASQDPEDLRVAFDGLCHLGVGGTNYFDRIAGQVDGGALFSSVFLSLDPPMGKGFVVV